MLADIGQMALATALVVSLVQAAAGLYGGHRDEAVSMVFAERSALVQAVLCVLAFGLLTVSFVQSDFSVRLVALHSHTLKPLLYKISGVWGNHEGSMLLWVTLMALFGAAMVWFGGVLPARFRARAVGIHGLVSAGFVAFLLFTSNPFVRLDPVPENGLGLNPLLQDPALALHPPFLYLGYVGFSVVFSFALAALVEGRVDVAWVRWIRLWTLLAWSFLTLGIVLGSVWAYYELGWGGWWFWDPVENVSFMPWLTGTALLHSILVARSRGSFMRWILLLAIMTFSLSLTGTFIVRSGILTSVHAFAVDPERGRFILLLLAGTIGGALILYGLRAGRIVQSVPFHPASRETGLALNNIFLLAVAATVFLGTVYPLVIDGLSGDRITVGPPYFERTVGPIMGVLVFVMALAPHLKWRVDSLVRFRRIFVWLGLCALPVFLFVFITTGRLAGSVGMGLGAWLFAGTLISYVRRVKIVSPGRWKRFLRLPAATHGFVLAHAGMAVTVIGIAAMGTWSGEVVQRVRIGEVVSLAGHQFRLTGITKRRGANFVAETARIAVEKNGRTLARLAPEQRIYPVEQDRTTEGAMTVSPLRVLYVVKGEGTPETGWLIRAYYHPLVAWIWFGALMMAAGGLVSLSGWRSSLQPVGRAGQSPGDMQA